MSPPGHLLRTGTTFRGYEILERLGAGGMGVVYRARDSKLGRTVALKFLPSTSSATPQDRQRFLIEAQAASALDHPNVGVIHGIEEAEDGELCIVMSCYEGQTLAGRIGGSPMPPIEAIRIAQQVADGLAEAHAHGIVHRDIKPSNIFLPRKGGLKILDFGLAKLVHGDAEATQTAGQLGTPAYMSPEQVRGAKISEATDVWGVGVVLYEMLTGERPFQGTDSYSLLFSIVNGDTPRNALIPPPLEAIIFRALSKDPAQRYVSMEEFAGVLRRTGTLLDGAQQETNVMWQDVKPVPLTPTSVPAAHTGRSRRSWIAMAVAGATVAASAIALYYNPGLFRKPPSASTLAILPFTGSSDPAQAAIAGGFAEALTKRVTAFERFQDSLTVIPVSELISRKIKDAADARRRLGATTVISGVMKPNASGGVALDLAIEGRDYPQPVTSRTTEASGDFLKLEEQASGAIASILDIGITSSEQSSRRGSKAYALYLSGLGYLQRWDVAENRAAAMRVLEEAQATDPAFSPVQVALSDAYRLRFASTHDPEDLQKALQHARKAVQLDDKLPAAHVALGRVYVQTAQRDMAVVEFKRVLDLDPRNWAAIVGTARTYEDIGRKDEAEKAFVRSVALRPYSFGPYNELATFYLREKRYAEAEVQFRKALEVTPDNSAMYSNLAVVLRRQNKFDDAIRALRKSLELNPSYAAYSNLGNIYYLRRQFTDAAGAYDSALKMNDKDFRLWGARAQALAKSGGDKAQVSAALRRAIEGAREALAVQPDAARTLSLVALYHARLGEKDNAKQLIARALRNPGGDYGVMTDGALVYEAVGMRDEALRWIRKALDEGYSWEEFRTDPDFATLAE